MYSGAVGYFRELAQRFPLQNGTSYFSLQNDHWLIVGLDTAYYADEMNLYMDGALGDQQTAWLKQLAQGCSKRILLLSHHQGYSIDGTSKTALYDQVLNALGREPDYWYWATCTTSSAISRKASSAAAVLAMAPFPMAGPAFWTTRRGWPGPKHSPPATTSTRIEY